MTQERRRYYVGLAASLHDPAIAILSPEGLPLFVEGTERYLQNKRAYNCAPDDLIRTPRLIEQFCEPDAELIVAVSWSDQMLRNLSMASFASFVDPVSATFMSQHMNEFAWPLPESDLMLIGSRNNLSQAGINLKSSRRIPNAAIIRRYDHHMSHAAHAAYTSQFDECCVAVVDGYGENRSTSLFLFNEGRLEILPGQSWDSDAELRQQVSLGHFYARICAACGFDPILGEEWKVMGLAAYGHFDPSIEKILHPMLRVSDLGLKVACSDHELRIKLDDLKRIGRQPGQAAEKVADLAATGQHVFEDWSTELLLGLHEAAPSENLALCGGCALNSSYNGRILERTPFRHLHVPSAPADDGCALGAAMLAFVEDHPGVTLPAGAASAYLGSTMSPTALQNLKSFAGLRDIERTRTDLLNEVSDMLIEGLIVGWIQGQAEFGPRALGNRSILADARREEMKDRLNSIVKFREEFRPFAPSVLDEYGAEYFENYQTSRYMERTLRFRPEKMRIVPAVVHVDGTGRLQSVRHEWNPLFYDLISAFNQKTGVPLVLNTSLNVMGKPIVHSLEDALGLFLTTGLDALVVENCVLRKKEMASALF